MQRCLTIEPDPAFFMVLDHNESSCKPIYKTQVEKIEMEGIVASSSQLCTNPKRILRRDFAK